MENDLLEPILGRVYDCTDRDNRRFTLTVIIGKPYLRYTTKPTIQPWACKFKVQAPERETVQTGIGADSINVLLITLTLLRVWLESYRRRHGVKITWQGDEHLGLSMVDVHID